MLGIIRATLENRITFFLSQQSKRGAEIREVAANAIIVTDIVKLAVGIEISKYCANKGRRGWGA
ncbi:hypothetical protein DNHGIG_18810 [Collibacillus ludicampi]|uniref:Uncharacterized protein n=1 Tax=Collibacillus ludicampi TaxID=2771369 RepID=A0AAV4LFU6_9BACL|nr:hypothetical protein DNHGIG_18810 [Collibacillus ludicampi]